MVRDLSDKTADFRKLKSQQRRAQSYTPLRNATVSGGNTNFIGLVSIEVEGSGLVTGLWDVDGELRLGGTMNADGTINLTGDFIVAGAGKIKAGNLTIDDAGGGRISHPTVLLLSAPTVGTNDLSVLGTLAVQSTVTSTGRLTAVNDVYLTNLPNKTGTGLLVGLLWRDPATGRLHKITS